MPPDPSLALAVTGADSALGARVVAALGTAPAGGTVVGISDDELRAGDLKPALEGVDVVVHLASATPEPLEGSRRLLEAAGDAAISRLVVLSSALVYGAWPTNPVPLTDDAPLRPNPGFEPAVALGEVERAVADWRDAHPAATTLVLRPAVPVSADDRGWLAPMLAALRGVPAGDDPPAQFVDVDDLVAAVVLAARGELTGAANVAPDGWLSGEELRALAGRPAVRLPGRLAERIASWRWRAGMSPTPPGLLPWTLHPWVVSSDALRAAGWSPVLSNAEAFVAGHRAAPWSTVSPKRRQELSLAASGAAGVAAVVGAVALARKLRRR